MRLFSPSFEVSHLVAGRKWRLLSGGAILATLIFSVLAALLLKPFDSRAVQNPTLAIDMVTSGNTYDDTTNMMTVGTVNNCLTSATANPLTHVHATQVIIQNVEDLIGWQARLNYIGDKMRPSTVGFTMFTDNTTAQTISFNNLPIDQTTFVHRDLVTASSIPAAPSDGTNTPQTAAFGATYIGTPNFAISADTPAKATPDDTSYSAPSGGVLASLNLQVVGNESGNQLFMNLDDGNPNAPGSGIAFFNGTGAQDVPLPSSALGDGFHGEGVTCAPLDCTTQECPPATPCPAGCITATPTGTPTCCPTSPTITPTATATATPTPTPTGVHDAGIRRLGSPTSVHLVPGVPDTSGKATVVIANNNGDHADLIGVYLAFLPPAGSQNPGGCSPAGVQNLGALTLLPGDKLTVTTDPPWQCVDPAGVDGATWTLKAIADVHGDDFASCATVQQVFSGECNAALANDDNNSSNNTMIRAQPHVVALSP